MHKYFFKKQMSLIKKRNKKLPVCKKATSTDIA